MSISAVLPISFALEDTWLQFLANEPAGAVDWRTVEITCMLERLLAYATTGKASVLPIRLLDELGAKHTLKNYGVPSFSEALIIRPHLSIQIRHWPIENGEAILNAESAIEYHYNKAVAYVSVAVSSQCGRPRLTWFRF